MKFQIGDRVVCVVAGGGEDAYFSYPACGMVGTVTATAPGRLTTGVCFDREFALGNRLDGSAPDRHGWWCSEDTLELIENPADTDIVVDLEEVL